MFYSLVIAVLGIVCMMLFWVLVQQVWRNLFADQMTDEDVLAERRSCGNCGCGTTCSKQVKTV